MSPSTKSTLTRVLLTAFYRQQTCKLRQVDDLIHRQGYYPVAIDHRIHKGHCVVEITLSNKPPVNPKFSLNKVTMFDIPINYIPLPPEQQKGLKVEGKEFDVPPLPVTKEQIRECFRNLQPGTPMAEATTQVVSNIHQLLADWANNIKSGQTA